MQSKFLENCKFGGHPVWICESTHYGFPLVMQRMGVTVHVPVVLSPKFSSNLTRISDTMKRLHEISGVGMTALTDKIVLGDSWNGVYVAMMMGMRKGIYTGVVKWNGGHNYYFDKVSVRGK